MKLSFSTLACPGYTWAELYSVAKDFGFHGIEMRGLGGDIFDVHASPFRPENLPETRATLKRLKLEICCLSSGCALKFADRHAETIAELKEYIALAKELGTPYIRVLGDLKAEPEEDFSDENVIGLNALNSLAALIANNGLPGIPHALEIAVGNTGGGTALQSIADALRLGNAKGGGVSGIEFQNRNTCLLHTQSLAVELTADIRMNMFHAVSKLDHRHGKHHLSVCIFSFILPQICNFAKHYFKITYEIFLTIYMLLKISGNWINPGLVNLDRL